MTVKRSTLAFIVGMLTIAVVAVPALAFANAGVHGGYPLSTDACAACHRAHTAPSAVTWTDTENVTQSALLLGEYTTVSEFCLTCHGSSGQGADTNVVDGVYLARDTVAANYGTVGAPLISGPFGRPGGVDSEGNAYSTDYWGNRVTSTHDRAGGTWGAWGGGVYTKTFEQDASWLGEGIGTNGRGDTQITMDCATCHDIHGTSNYRMLKDNVYGVPVGGYNLTVPTPFVRSVEPGFPAGGFEKGVNYISGGFVTPYVPNYTTANYAKGYSNAAATVEAPLQGMSGWCVGCHTVYMGTEGGSDASVYRADEIYGTVTRHRHPMNQPLTDFKGPVPVDVANWSSYSATQTLPLAHDFSEVGAAVDDNGDWIECLSCHYAHGTTATMSGWARVLDPSDPNVVPNNPAANGVPPADSSTLLRFNDRYVCQACHQK